MSKKNKIIESNIQPNHKEAEIWIKQSNNGIREIKYYNNVTNKWEGSQTEGTQTMPQYIGFELWQPFMFGDGYTWRMSINVEYEGPTFEALTYITDYTILNLPTFSIDENGYILINGCFLYSYYMGLYPGDTENDVKVLATDAIESRMYSMEPHVGGGPA